MPRALPAIVLSLGLGLHGALPEPHLHADDHGQASNGHHDGPTIHAHAAAHPTPSRGCQGTGPIVEADDHDDTAYALTAIGAARQPRSAPLDALVPMRAWSPLPDRTAVRAAVLCERAHGPPALALAPPRAPPA